MSVEIHPWTDRAGRFSWIRSLGLAAAILPAVWIAGQAATGSLGARPWIEAIDQSGLWAIRFLLASLAITPLRRMGIVPRLVIIRRLLGLTALAYALLHLALFTLDQADLWVALREIALRFYLLIGAVALAGLVTLGLTSTDAAIRRMGRRWHRLHALVYPIAAVAVVHFFLQSKLMAGQAVVMGGLFAFALLARGAVKLGFTLAAPVTVAGVAVLAGLVTAGLETGWYTVAANAPPLRVLAANLDFSPVIRPAWWVAGTGLALAAVVAVRGLRLPLLRQG